MDADYDTSVAGRIARVNADFQKRQKKLFTRFALIEGGLLVLAILVVYVLKLVSPDVGTGILVGIVLVCGVVLSTLMTRMIKARQSALEQAGGRSDPA